MDSALPQKKTALSKIVKIVIKLVVTTFCFWYISTKIDFSNATKALLDANWWALLTATLLYAISKLFSAFRLNIYFKNLGLHLSQKINTKLYWLGMFYNLFLPGAIGGDAYKVILLNKRMQAPYKKTSTAVLLDRFSGLLGLGIILSIYGVIVLDNKIYEGGLICAAIIGIAGLYYVIKAFFREFLNSFWTTLAWGLLVQATQVVCIYFILLSLGLPIQNEWVFIFLLASAVSVLPISLGGGLGTRELVFAEGARFFHLNPEVGVVISLLFFLCNVLSCIWGAYFVFVDPLKNASSTLMEKQ